MSYELFWGCYWLLVVLSIIIAIVALVEKYWKTGLPSLILALEMPIFSFLFAFTRDWVGTDEDELTFLWRQLQQGAWEAYFIIIANGILLFLTGYHLVQFTKKRPSGYPS